MTAPDKSTNATDPKGMESQILELKVYRKEYKQKNSGLLLDSLEYLTISEPRGTMGRADS